ncbi:Tannase/feruloyl esterase [Dendryphion nanum]|uniref:Carboxylic ester hydrolase n=1 Tax=Dendryphion nanum TaxID=256645 RepID=A0A9P9I9Q9_9PLEO|nr:Tannase/feruloyl esterase [Dendryphion nanum]
MSTDLLGACVPATFNPTLFGASILNLQAHPVTDYSVNVNEAFRQTQPSVQADNIRFCNVTVSLTHPGQNDNVVFEIWLPIDNWNNRFQAVGGGGWIAGGSKFILSLASMQGAIADGYATMTTDAGLGSRMDAEPWALASPGNVNLYNLESLGSKSLYDGSILGKSIIRDFYGKGPDYSYWNGCSQGGRQGLMLAQRFPKAYDGIAASAPAIYWTELFPSILWGQQIMNELNEYPSACEFEAITAAAVAACDGLDGVDDGIINNPEECLATFNPFETVGKSFECAQSNVGTITISTGAAIIMNATWHGMRAKDGRRIYPGPLPGADMTSDFTVSWGQTGILDTTCSANGTCVGAPHILGRQWFQLFIAKNPEWTFGNLTREEFDNMSYMSRQQYRSMIGTDDPDLSNFRNAGGKMITFHGLADNIIPSGASEQYYHVVAQLLPDVRDFYRYYEAPGLGHCFGGPSQNPTSLFSQLRAWVENGTVPEHTPIKVNAKDGTTHNRILCPYPQKAQLTACRDPADAECWSCVGATSLSSTKKGYSGLYGYRYYSSMINFLSPF